MKCLTKRRVRFRLHIDNINNVGGDVWAVSYGTTYLTAHGVVIGDVSMLIGGPVRKRQPRAFLTGVGSVWTHTKDGVRTIFVGP